MVENGNKIILRSMLSPGDIMVLTAAVESLHRLYPGEYITDVRTSVDEIWENNPHITKLSDDEKVVECHYSSIQECSQTPIAFLEGYTRYLGEELDIPIKLMVNRPYLYLTEDEKGWLNQVEEVTKKKVPFWLLNAGVKDDYPLKQWLIEHYEEVVRRTSGHIQWVQVGASEHDHVPISGAINLIGKTSHRQLIRLAYHCQGGLGPVTYLQHLCAAFEKRYVCILGGREPVSWVQYPKQTTLHTMGALPCCENRACWRSTVSECEMPVLGYRRLVGLCMAMIQPAEVIAAIR